MNRYLAVFGTRPEVIKMAPLIHAASARAEVVIEVCSTGQHREMLAQAFDAFELSAAYDLELMTANQGLSEFHSAAVTGIHKILKADTYDGVIVQGDTASALAGAIAGFHLQLPVVHVEAGLRTWDMANPFPEEGNRTLIDSVASICAAPTDVAADNLRKMGVEESRIHVTGNTAIDALLYMKHRNESSGPAGEMNLGSSSISVDDKIISVTGHRRESFGPDFENICSAIREIAVDHPDVQIVYPVHLNPNVQEPVNRILNGIENVHLIEPLGYSDFVNLLANSYLILTDSGGIQEEAPSLDVPVLVMRKTTERPEGVAAGSARLVGVSRQSITDGVNELLNDNSIYSAMAQAPNPYGDGTASEQILDLL